MTATLYPTATGRKHTAYPSSRLAFSSSALAFSLLFAPSSTVGVTPPFSSYTTPCIRETAQGTSRGLSVPIDHTSSGLPPLDHARAAEASRSPAQQIAELRASTGLTTDQVGRLIGVSRRSVQNWIGGGAMSSEHEERASKILAIVQALPASTTAERRTALLDSSRGTSLFHRLVAVRSESARLQVPGVSIRGRIEP